MNNVYINALINFIKENDDWETKLKKPPYNLKTVKQCSWNGCWYIFVYNLFSSELTNPVVRGCRGTVLKIVGKDVEVVSAPYTKFFGYGDPSGKDIEDSINWNNAKIQEKVDGIIIKTACVMDFDPYDGEPEKRLYFFTNGSFELNAPFEDSMVFDEPETRGAETYGDLLEYAIKKEDPFVRIHYNKEFGYFYITGGFADFIPYGSTLMLELTSPRNRIICDYKETKLWWHGYRDPDGIEHDPRELKEFSVPFESPRLYDAHNYDELKELLKTFNGKEQEGVVVVDYTTKDTPRAKIKCEDYLKLKFARDTSCNTQFLFKAVVESEYDDLIANVPATQPKIQEIINNIVKIENWFEAEKLRIKFKEFNTVKDYVFWVKENIKSSLFAYYMDMKNPDFMFVFEKKLRRLALKKHGYDELLNLLKEIEND